MNVCEFKAYLHDVAADFNPPLNLEVDIDAWCDRMFKYGCLITDKDSTNDSVIGILSGYFNHVEQGFAFLSIFHVRKEYRKNGVGRRLMDRASKMAKQLGFSSLRLNVKKDNHNAILFYERYGFNPIGCDDKRYFMEYIIKQ